MLEIFIEYNVPTLHVLDQDHSDHAASKEPMNRLWSGCGFISSIDVLWSERFWITYPDPDQPKEMLFFKFDA